MPVRRLGGGVCGGGGVGGGGGWRRLAVAAVAVAAVAVAAVAAVAVAAVAVAVARWQWRGGNGGEDCKLARTRPVESVRLARERPEWPE